MSLSSHNLLQAAVRFSGVQPMQVLVLTNVNDGVILSLQDRAVRHGRTPAEEAKAILTEALSSKTCGDTWAPVDAIYEHLASSGRTFADSVGLLREDRER